MISTFLSVLICESVAIREICGRKTHPILSTNDTPSNTTDSETNMSSGNTSITSLVIKPETLCCIKSGTDKKTTAPRRYHRHPLPNKHRPANTRHVKRKPIQKLPNHNADARSYTPNAPSVIIVQTGILNFAPVKTINTNAARQAPSSHRIVLTFFIIGSRFATVSYGINLLTCLPCRNPSKKQTNHVTQKTFTP